VTVLCHAVGAEAPQWPGVNWVVIGSGEASAAGSIASVFPSIVYRTLTKGMRRAFDMTLSSAPWDAVIFDGLSMAPLVRHETVSQATIAYVAHNHEASLRSSIAAAVGPTPTGLGLRVDAIKAAKSERVLVRRANVVSAITDADRARFAPDTNDMGLFVLAPGYDGPRRATRTIGPDTPRRAVMLGSFNWAAKQLNLDRALASLAAPLLRAGIGLDVVGVIPGSLAERMRRRHPLVRIHGAVDRIEPFLDRARVGIVAEPIGGGFKLKTLDYVFNRVPIATLVGGAVGMPLVADQSLIEAADLEELSPAIVQAIDDFDRLNAIHASAYAACERSFDWSDRGTELAGALESAAERHGSPGHEQLTT
jgi:glycosyltransferase involved in cell wall biosynthesis